MNGKKGSTETSIPVTNDTSKSEFKAIHQENSGGSGGCIGGLNAIISSVKTRVLSVWSFAKEDTSRVIYGFKVGLAVLLVSLLILIQAPYDVFGPDIIWSIITVAIMFEYTVGVTFNRGFNRALGSLLAVILAVCIGQIALLGGRIARPVIIGFSIFVVGALTSFLKQWPSLLPYEYGFRVVLFTFCLIIISGYRMGNPARTAMDRMYSIAIGGFVAVFVNLLIFPMWAGEQLHKELVVSFNAVSDSLEECVRRYFEDDGSDIEEFTKNVLDEFPDEPAYKKCKNILNSSAKIDSLATAAKWEPPHGRFNHFFYPWAEYVKVGAVLRYCAYEVMALHGVLHSEIQAPYNLRITFQSEIADATNQAVELLRSLGKDVSNMKRSLHTSLLKRVHSSTERLQHAISLHSYLLTSHAKPPDSATNHPPNLCHALSSSNCDVLNKTIIPSGVSPLAQAQTETYHETMRKHSRRLYSWPSREVDAFEEDGALHVDFLPRMRMLESTAALSLATFSSLLIEFVARLDHLVDAVDELSRMAKFKDEGL